MAKDAKLPEIEIKRDDFNTELQEEIAHILVDHWGKYGPADYKKLASEYSEATAEYTEDGATSSEYGKVMNEYLGPVDHDLTVEEIRARYGSVTEYLEERKRGEVETDTHELTDRELDLFKEGYREGYRDGLADGQ